jgi:FixJ family two-component response regulator
LLTDVVMPLMTGPELAHRLKPLRPQMRIVYMSGYAAKAIHTGMIAPTDTFLEKPFTHEVLIRTVREVLDNGQASAANQAKAVAG